MNTHTFVGEYPPYTYQHYVPDDAEAVKNDEFSRISLLNQLYSTYTSRMKTLTGHLRVVHHLYPNILKDYFKASDMLTIYFNGDCRFIMDLRNHKKYLEKIEAQKFKTFHDETDVYIPGSQHNEIIKAFIRAFPTEHCSA